MEQLLHPHHVHDRNALGDADNQLHPGIGCLKDGVRRELRRNKDHSGIAARRLACFVDGVKDGHLVVEFLAAPCGSDSGHDIRAVFHAVARVEGAGLAGDALHNQAGVFVDENGHD